MQDGQAAHAGVEHADRPRIHGRRLTAGTLFRCAPLRLLALTTLAAAVLAPGRDAGAFTKSNGVAVMDDGTRIGTTLYVPSGEAPTALARRVPDPRPRRNRKDADQIAESFFAPFGYAVLTYDLRGHGELGGFVTFAGAREIADLRALEQQFAARPEVNDLEIGAWGISYGAAQAWLAAAQGVPFKAIAVWQTWSDLFTSLYPNGVAKSGVIAGLLNEIPTGKLSPSLSWLPTPALSGQSPDQLRTFAEQRSVLPVAEA